MLYGHVFTIVLHCCGNQYQIIFANWQIKSPSAQGSLEKVDILAATSGKTANRYLVIILATPYHYPLFSSPRVNVSMHVNSFFIPIITCCPPTVLLSHPIIPIISTHLRDAVDSVPNYTSAALRSKPGLDSLRAAHLAVYLSFRDG